MSWAIYRSCVGDYSSSSRPLAIASSSTHRRRRIGRRLRRGDHFVCALNIAAHPNSSDAPSYDPAAQSILANILGG